MFNALLQRVPRGKSMTLPVRVKELMIECEISRRQVQICLRRLAEMGLIRRLTDDIGLGSQKGFRYEILRP